MVVQVSIDLLSWDFSVMTVDDSNVSGSPKVRQHSCTHAHTESLTKKICTDRQTDNNQTVALCLSLDVASINDDTIRLFVMQSS